MLGPQAQLPFPLTFTLCPHSPPQSLRTMSVLSSTLPPLPQQIGQAFFGLRLCSSEHSGWREGSQGPDCSLILAVTFWAGGGLVERKRLRVFLWATTLIMVERGRAKTGTLGKVAPATPFLGRTLHPDVIGRGKAGGGKPTSQFGAFGRLGGLAHIRPLLHSAL